jgi:hypothetical protein
MDINESRVIHLSLRKPFLENYLRFVFNSQEKGTIKITRCEEIGKYLYSRVRYSDYPQRKPKSQYLLELLLPDHPLDVSHNHFIYFTEDDQVRINDYIEAIAYLDFRTTVQVGSRDLKVDRKVVINLFSNLVFGEDKYEMLKKDEYRRRKKVEDWLLKSIQVFGY